MSWHKPTRRMAVLGLLALGGCGFTPVYGPGGTASSLRGTIRYQTPSTVAGFRLNTRLQDRLGSTADAQYTLAVTLNITQDSVAITDDGDITRVTLPGTANYVLRDTTGGVIAQGRVNSFTSYSTTGTTVATQAAAEDAEARLAIILADLITTRLLAAAP